MTWLFYPCRWENRALFETALEAVEERETLDLLITDPAFLSPAVPTEDGEGIEVPAEIAPGYHVSVACRNRPLPEGWPRINNAPVGMNLHGDIERGD